MNKKSFYLGFIFLVACFSHIKADVPPDTGSMRVYSPFVFDLAEDFSDYKFFLKSPIDVEEIQVRKGETTAIDNKNRGGAKRNAELIAIPSAELGKISFAQNYDEDSIKMLNKAIENKEINGIITLAKHSFQQDILISERSNWTYPTYRIERDGNSLKAVKTADISPKLSIEEEKKMNEGRFKVVMTVAGTMIGLAVLVFGIVLVRKVLKKG